VCHPSWDYFDSNITDAPGSLQPEDAKKFSLSAGKPGPGGGVLEWAEMFAEGLQLGLPRFVLTVWLRQDRPVATPCIT
jgi:hypothetical protein